MLVESRKNNRAKTSDYSLYRSLRPWHVLRWKLGELGRSITFLMEKKIRYVKTSLESED